MACVPSNSAPPIAPPVMLFQVPPVLPGEVDAQPGTRNAKANMARPWSGRLTTCLVSMVSDNTLDSVSSRGESPTTVTVSCVAPTLSTAFTSVVRPVCTWRSSNIWVSKPVLEIDSRYRPKATFGKEKAPLDWVAPFWTMLVAVSLNLQRRIGNGRSRWIGHGDTDFAHRTRLTVRRWNSCGPKNSDGATSRGTFHELSPALGLHLNLR